MSSETGKKVGYLKGLLEAMDSGDKESRKKLLHGIVDVLSDLSDRADTMTDLIVDLNDYVESIDDDLSSLEDGEGPIRFDDEDDAVEFPFKEGERQLRLWDDDDDDDDDEEAFEPDDDDDEPLDLEKEFFLDTGVCPECKKPFLIRFNLFEDSENQKYICPHCHKKVNYEIPSPDNMVVAEKAEEE